MDISEYTRKLAELGRLMNDPEGPMQPQALWALLAELAKYDLAAATLARGG
ncbi:MAG: peptide chain release factor 1 [Acidocella sp.]|nr:peptide chain release factor 1 [Acidocella sp.]